MAGDDACTLKEIPIENKVWLDYLDKSPTSLPPVIGAPVSELFSVGLRHDSEYFKQRDKLEIYGFITLYDEDYNTYELYRRSPDNPQTLTPQHNLLSLGMPAEGLISTSWSLIFLWLTDKADDSLIISESLSFDKLSHIHQYNQVQELSKNSVFVTYAAFPVGVVGILEITLKTNDSAHEPLNISGKITVHRGNTYGSKYPGIVLCNRLSNGSFEVLSDGSIQLDRDVVAVPAYSFIRIHLQLSQHQQKDINCCADFLARHLYAEHRDIVVQGFVVRFNVKWCHPYELRDETSQPFEPPVVVCLPDPQLPRPLVEVYTIVLHHNTDRELEIFGTMSGRDNWSRFLLFDRDELNPVKISGNEETIPIDVKWRCFNMTEYLGMRLVLKDVKGDVLIDGEIGWTFRNVERPMSWYDERICSVIRGRHGYAEVFYTIFSKAVQAKIRILFMCTRYPDVSHRFRGSVVASHSNETYLTEHDKAYYQSVLCRGNSSDIPSGCTLPLSKSVVAVPIDAVLTVAVDLYANPLSPGLQQEHLKSDVCFRLGSDLPRTIEDKNCSVEVSVEWSDLDKLFTKEWDLTKNDYEKVSKLQFTEF